MATRCHVLLASFFVLFVETFHIFLFSSGELLFVGFKHSIKLEFATFLRCLCDDLDPGTMSENIPTKKPHVVQEEHYEVVSLVLFFNHF